MQKGEGTLTALRTSCHHRPNAFEPALAFVATRALRHFAIEHHEANRLFRQVVGRFDAGSCDESQVTFAVLSETLRQVLSFRGVRHMPENLGRQKVASVLQLDLKAR